ncbi:O-antigen ligase family protein [candidate division KSB1 bacterium]|nr:O-antigen ligase family protein [candidate division KSB1 bacterium]RQW10474.1 MAG: O-antigen ligase family protein [candidate division KSB1 bacterium]
MKPLMLARDRHTKVFQFLLFLLIGLFIGVAITLVAELPNEAFYVITIGLALPFLTFLVKDLRRFLLVASLCTIPVHLDINFMHSFERQAGASTAGISITDIFILGLLLIWLIELVTRAEPYALFFSRITLPAILYVEMAAMSMLWAPRVDLAFMEVFRMVKVFMLFFILLNTIRDQRDVRLAMWALLATVAFESIIAGLQMVRGGRLGLEFLGEAPPDPDGDAALWRVMGTLGHPNRLATYLELLLPLSLGAFLIEKKAALKVTSIGIFALGLATLIMTGCRGAWVGFAVSFLIFIIFSLRNRHVKVKTILKPVLLALLLMLMVATLFSDMLTQRFFGDDFGSAASRIPMYQIAVNVISANPLGGVGINNYQVNMREYNDSVRAMQYTTIPRPVHNMYLLVAGETGFIGFAVMILMLVSLIRILVRTAASSSPFFALVSICILSGVCAFCVHGLVDKHPPGGYAPFYALMALASSSFIINRRRHSSSHL